MRCDSNHVESHWLLPATRRIGTRDSRTGSGLNLDGSYLSCTHHPARCPRRPCPGLSTHRVDEDESRQKILVVGTSAEVHEEAHIRTCPIEIGYIAHGLVWSRNRVGVIPRRDTRARIRWSRSRTIAWTSTAQLRTCHLWSPPASSDTRISDAHRCHSSKEHASIYRCCQFL